MSKSVTGQSATEKTEKKTEIEIKKSNFSDLNGCLTMLLLIILCAAAGNLLKISKIRLECEIIKLERMQKDTIPSHAKDGTVVTTPDTLKLDTLKIGKYQNTYVPLIRQIQRQKGN